MASPCDPDLFDFFAQFNVLLKSKQNANLTMKCRNGRASVILKLDIDVENKNNHHSSCQIVHENSRSRRRKKRAFERQCKKQNEQNDANATTCNAQMKPLLQLLPLTKIKKRTKDASIQTSTVSLATKMDVSCGKSSPIPNLTMSVLPSVNVPPFIRPSTLAFTRNKSISIPPRKVYHPSIINACMGMLGKHPSQLTEDEAAKFSYFQQYKKEQGDPNKTSLSFRPIDMKNCLHCGHLT